jgi:hypothetical protein
LSGNNKSGQRLTRKADLENGTEQQIGERSTKKTELREASLDPKNEGKVRPGGTHKIKKTDFFIII